MNLKEEILKEHSKQHAMKIAVYATASPDRFKTLMHCFMTNDYRLAQRAAWSVNWAARKKPGMIKPYIKDLVAVLDKKDVHDAVIRNSLRILEDIDIPERYHGAVINTCMNFIEKPAIPAALKAYSMTIVANLSGIYPEIKQELKLIIEENWDNATPAFRSRGKKILKQI